ncbi:hypothetical protein JXK06_02910 [Patescibacteria group bacterium]|nr:hypothetical protein [Patescibacteria group bacterium]
MGTSQVYGTAPQGIDAKIEKEVKVFCDNSLRVLRLKKGDENTIRSVLSIYESLSKLVGPMTEMGKISDTFESSVKSLICEYSENTAYDARTMVRIQQNLDDYFLEDRYPSEAELETFYKFVKEQAFTMEVEQELVQNFHMTKSDELIRQSAFYYQSF